MRIKLLDVASRNLIDGQLLIANLKDMKDHIHDKWHFDWKRHFSLPNSKAFKIVTISKPEQIEGLMIFQMLQKSVPYMAYLESAPGNVGDGKKIDRIAGCLIAKACQLSFIEGKDHFQGYLALKCMDEPVIRNYGKYGAVRLGKSNEILIEPDIGKKIIADYLQI